MECWRQRRFLYILWEHHGLQINVARNALKVKQKAPGRGRTSREKCIKLVKLSDIKAVGENIYKM